MKLLQPLLFGVRWVILCFKQWYLS